MTNTAASVNESVQTGHSHVGDYGLPQLPYDLHHKKKGLFIVGALLLVEFCAIPLVLYYTLWYLTDLRHGALFAIVTAFFGIVTGLDYALRLYRLTLKDDRYRPLGGSRWKLDYFCHANGFGFTVMTGILIGASIPHEPLTRILAIPVPVFLIIHGVPITISAVLCHLDVKTPFRISSTPKGARFPPLIGVLVEDAIAVDGNGGKEYRLAWKARNEASPVFRKSILYLSYFWGSGMVVIGVVCLILIFFTDPKQLAFGLGWGVPNVWCIIWISITVVWVHRAEKEEKRWVRDHCEIEPQMRARQEADSLA